MTRCAPRCPLCGAHEPVPIVYGPPGPKLERLVREGRVVLGDRVRARDDPEWRCSRCGYEWRLNEERA